MQDIRKIQYDMNTPCLELRDYIQTLWFAENLENTGELTYKILNDGASGVIFNFGDKLVSQYGNGDILHEAKTITLGPSKELLKLTFTGKVQTIGIRFFPFTGHHFFNIPMLKLSEKILKTSAYDFLGQEDLHAQLKVLIARASPKQEIIAFLEIELKRIIRLKHSQPQSLLINLFKAILLKPSINLEELSLRFSISKRDIQRLFKNYVGITPKAFIRLNKVRVVKDKIAQNEFTSLTQLSLDSGYFDQSHFIRDFKSFMEDTPKKYHEYKKEVNK